jgi:hypothetical protein
MAIVNFISKLLEVIYVGGLSAKNSTFEEKSMHNFFQKEKIRSFMIGMLVSPR